MVVVLGFGLAWDMPVVIHSCVLRVYVGWWNCALLCGGGGFLVVVVVGLRCVGVCADVVAIFGW